jgi:hypothetical protein
MNRDRLYDFFITDDSARMKAFVWCAAFGIASSMEAHFLLGVDETISAIILASVTTIVLLIYVALYVTVFSVQPQKVGDLAIGRRRTLKLFLVSALESAAALLVTDFLEDTSAAMAYAGMALFEVRAGGNVSPLRIELAKQAITAAMRNSSPIVSKDILAHAYTEMVLAEFYLRAKKTQMIFAEAFVDGANEFFRINGSSVHNAVVIRAYVTDTKQDLTGIGWLDTQFESCTLRATIKDLLLVNVSFKDCSILFPSDEMDSPIARELRSGTKSGVTFSSDSLAIQQGSTQVS